MKKNVIITCLVATVPVLLFAYSCNTGDKGEFPNIRFAAIPSGSAGLVYIAQEKGFFHDEGLTVTVSNHPTGVATTDALLAGEVEIAWAAEFPMVSRAFAGEDISIFAVSSRFSDQYLFGLKDRGIENIADLKGKTIGLPLKTIAEFYLARFLELNGMSMEDVSPVSVLPPRSVEALSEGSVEGVVTWEPYTSIIKEQMAGSITAWAVQSSQPGFGVMVARNGWLERNGETLVRFLRALAKSEEYMIHNEEEAKDIVQARVGYDDEFIEIFWSENTFALSLDQALITAMEDEARWILSNSTTTWKDMPDITKYIYSAALEAVRPEAVSIIR